DAAFADHLQSAPYRGVLAVRVADDRDLHDHAPMLLRAGSRHPRFGLAPRTAADRRKRTGAAVPLLREKLTLGCVFGEGFATSRAVRPAVARIPLPRASSGRLPHPWPARRAGSAMRRCRCVREPPARERPEYV